MNGRHIRLLVVVLAAVVFLAVGWKAGYWVTAGVAMSLGVVWWSVSSRKRGCFLPLRFVVGIIAMLALWFLAVDWSWFVEYCPGCLGTKDIAQYRILGLPIHTTVCEDPTNIERAMEDLGVPCLHEHSERWHKHRWWGLQICACPCINGIYGFSGKDERYTHDVSARLRERGKADPVFAEELHRRVIDQHDYRYFWEAFMVDEFAPESLDDPNTEEALAWLQGATETDLRLISSGKSAEESVTLIQEVYDAGAPKVFAINIRECWRADKIDEHEANAILIELPNEPEARRQVFLWAGDQAELREDDRPRDFGQKYLHVLL